VWRASLSLSWMTRAWTVWMVWCRLKSDERDLRRLEFGHICKKS
jgi:hypothetical protein